MYKHFDISGLSARNLRIFIAGVRGADGDEGLDALTSRVATAQELDDDELASLTESIRDAAIALIEGDPTQENLDAARAALEQVQALEAIAAERAADAEERATAAADLLAQLRGESGEDDGERTEASDEEEEDGEGEGDPGEEGSEADEGGSSGTEGEGESEEGQEASGEAESEPEEAATPAPERVAAAASRVTRMAPRRPDVRPRQRPSAAPQFALRASSNVPGVTAGEVLNTPERIGQAFGEALRAGRGHRGPRTLVTVASIGDPFDASAVFGEERTLDDNARRNEQKVNSIASPEAVRASGGQCAPTPVDYTQPLIGTDARPTRDALARFGADRGGVRLIPPPQLSDVSGAVDVWTHATDVTPGGDTKNCLTMTCPSDVETFVDAITQCIKVGNFRQQYWPEQVDAWVRKAAMAAARTAEERLLTQIGAGSKNLSAAQQLGATRDVLATLDHALAGFRSRQRVPRNTPLRLLAPEWMVELMRADLTRQAPGDSGSGIERLAMADTAIAQFFSTRNVNVQWVLDGETGQEFGAQNDGSVLAFPNHVVIYLFVEGSWLHLDGGQLNLGVVRDATLVGTNDFIMFSEFMEAAAFHGTESQRIEIDICPSGTATALTTFTCPAAS